jgi:putative FmdB family regulatory protein
MPTYEYECTKCNHAFEEEASITAPARQRCPRCRGKVQRLISGGSGIVFKGSGFYVNDSRRKPASAASDASSAAQGPSTSTGDKSGVASKSDGASGSGTTGSTAAPANDSKSRKSDKP